MYCPTCGTAIETARQTQCPGCGRMILNGWDPDETAPGHPVRGADHAAQPLFDEPPTALMSSQWPPDRARPSASRSHALPYREMPSSSSLDGSWPSDPMRTRTAWDWDAPHNAPGLPDNQPAWPAHVPARKTPVNRLLGVVAVVLVAVLVAIGLRTLVNHDSAGGTASPSATIFADSLRSDTGQWTNQTGQCYFAKDGYHILNGHVCFAPVASVADGDFAVYAKQIAGDPSAFYGMALRATPGNFYEFAINAQGQWIFTRVVNTLPSSLRAPQPSSYIAQGLNHENRLEAKVAGDRFDLYINGHQVGTVTDSAYRTGASGLLASPSMEAVFADYLIKR